MKDSLLWELVHPRTGVAHYLFGTMHVSNEGAYKHIPLVKEYISSCAVYAGEMDLEDPLLMELTTYFELPSGMSLKGLYGDKKYEKLRAIIQKAFSVELDRYNLLRPMIVSNMLAEKVLTASYDVALDQHLWSLASELGLETTGLESAADQIKILQSIPIPLQKQMLSKSLQNVSKYKKKIVKISRLYEEGKLGQLFLSSKRSLGELRKPLLYDRNYSMADRIDILAVGDSVFSAIGAAHLGGKFGVLRLLKKSGYIIKPIYH